MSVEVGQCDFLLDDSSIIIIIIFILFIYASNRLFSFHLLASSPSSLPPSQFPIKKFRKVQNAKQTPVFPLFFLKKLISPLASSPLLAGLFVFYRKNGTEMLFENPNTDGTKH